ncbi:MAG: hypothetical protein KBG47_01850 [Bacteroidia bacterium]|jgi:hypothetical protein|nr:hypothetical protein [Sphingobacteriaceae bacterium]MBP9068221.1 hypothetical protein [Bacteroidia bacterium]
MALLLNRIIIIFLLFTCYKTLAQNKRPSDNDYQTREEFKKFHRRAIKVGSWQIQNLKFGAIVIRLQNDKRKVDGYLKVGDERSAIQVQAEAQYRNRSIISAALSQIDFCKVYFIFSQSSDSLLAGKRNDMFVDSTLKVQSSIVMNEKFYVLLEEDFLYLTSIGFVKEDSAKYAVERGHTNGNKPFLFKNKYGHQLKSPFPYKCSTNLFFIKKVMVRERVELEQGKSQSVKFRTVNAYKYYSSIFGNTNIKLYNFYQSSEGQQVSDPELKPFLY